MLASSVRERRAANRNRPQRRRHGLGGHQLGERQAAVPVIASLALSVSMVGNALRCGERSIDTVATNNKQVPRQPSRDSQPAQNSRFWLTSD